MIDLLVISHACFMGINRNIYHLFLKDGWNVELIVPKTLNFPTGRKEAEKPGENDPPIHYLALQGENPRTYGFDGLMDVLATKKPKIVLLDNDPVSRLALQVGSWCRRNNAKLFCLSCENLSLDISSTIKRRGWKSLPAALAKRIMLQRTRNIVDGVFTINQDGKRIFVEEGYKGVAHLPLGFDPQYFFVDEQARQKLRKELKLDTKVIAYFGRLTPEKGIHILIKALENLKDHSWQLMMDDFDEYASGYNKEIQRLIHNAGIAERVVYINPSHAEIAKYMNAADVVVVPSIASPRWKEQYGRVAAEALACGKLVVASDSGALPELLGGQGFLFPEGDAPQLANLLSTILTGSINNSPGIAATEQIAGYAREQLSIYKQKEIMLSSFGSLNTGR